MKSLSTVEICRFRKHLLDWHAHENKREMPWKGIKNPYFIWLSEIILQQTRVEQGLAYYERFIERFPTLPNLARADEGQVFHLWQGLGYYSRCRNLIKAAQHIDAVHGGVFPNNYEALRALPGVGDYTAAAIASFAFRLPHAAVDGNVIRILSRYAASEETPATAKGKRFYAGLAQTLLAEETPDLFNQAMMDLGATVCTPQQPQCSICPLRNDCKAYKRNQTSLFPVKKKKNPLKHRHFHFVVFSNRTHIALLRREQGDIWADLYTPWLIEGTDTPPEWPKNRAFSTIQREPERYHQVLSHQKIFGYFYTLGDPGKTFLMQHKLHWIPKKAILDLAFPRLVLVFLKNSGYL